MCLYVPLVSVSSLYNWFDQGCLRSHFKILEHKVKLNKFQNIYLSWNDFQTFES